MATKKTAKKQPAKKTKGPLEVLDLFLKAVTELYPHDKSAPGLVLSYLQDKKEYYASFARYEGAMGQGKQVVTNHTAKTLEDAITGLAQKWYNGIPSARALRSYCRTMPDDFMQD